jgi:hypothetical protein
MEPETIVGRTRSRRRRASCAAPAARWSYRSDTRLHATMAMSALDFDWSCPLLDSRWNRTINKLDKCHATILSLRRLGGAKTLGS